jgi:hypothetical protein
MTQYVMQTIEATKFLIKSYEVTPDCPIRGTVPSGRLQAIITDTNKFNDAVAAFNASKGATKFTIADNDITW